MKSNYRLVIRVAPDFTCSIKALTFGGWMRLVCFWITGVENSTRRETGGFAPMMGAEQTGEAWRLPSGTPWALEDGGAAQALEP